MEIDFFRFQGTLNFSILVHFPVSLDSISVKDGIGFVCRKRMDEKDILSYLNPNHTISDLKIEQVLKMVHFNSQGSISTMSLLEMQKLQLAKILLHLPKMIVLEYFFVDMIDCEVQYFKRLFRNLLYKKGVFIVLIENDMNFICETVKKMYLFTKSGKFQLIDDFYDDKIYEYVEMPYTVELVKYLESKGHHIDHDVTFLETLKAIYRGVS